MDTKLRTRFTKEWLQKQQPSLNKHSSQFSGRTKQHFWCSNLSSNRHINQPLSNHLNDQEVGEDYLEAEEDYQEEEDHHQGEDRNMYSQYHLNTPNNQYNSCIEETTAGWKGENQTYTREIGRKHTTGCTNGAYFAIQI